MKNEWCGGNEGSDRGQGGSISGGSKGFVDMTKVTNIARIEIGVSS